MVVVAAGERARRAVAHHRRGPRRSRGAAARRLRRVRPHDRGARRHPLQRVEIFNNEALDKTLGAAAQDLQAASRTEALLFTAAPEYGIDVVAPERAS